jgi:hypothetical protein
MITRTIAAWSPVILWVATIVCFVAGTWGGRPSLGSLVPSLVVLYVVSAARMRHTRKEPV